MNRTRRVLERLGMDTPGDWAAFFLAMVLAVLLAFIFAAWWSM